LDAHAGFSIGRDGFSISNSPGYCFAMVAFSRWYYLRNEDGPPLRSTVAKKAQTRIAKEIQGYYSKHLVGLQANYCNRYHGNQSNSFHRFLMGIMMGEPRLVLLMNRSGRGAILHAVLAYGWMPEQKMVRVYDPNYRNEERFIDLERKEYESLDITYNAICFPEVLHNHAGLVTKMERLYKTYVMRKSVAAVSGNRTKSP